jgi:DNA-binding transcriptional LysR family regulator
LRGEDGKTAHLTLAVQICDVPAIGNHSHGKSLLRHGEGSSVDYFAAMRSFTRAVELGSFSKAAEESGMKVSTVSRYISALEADLGATLFNRTTRRLHLTEAGKTFYDRAAQILAELEDARNATSSLNAQPRGLLRINIPGAFGRLHVMPHMKDFLAQYPEIRLDATLTDATVDVIATGTDVAIRIGTLAESSLIARRLAPHTRLLVASPGYLAAYPALEAPEALHRHECLAFALQPANSWHYRPRLGAAAELAEISVSGHLRANDSDTLHQAVLDGLGIALLPTWLVGPDLRAGKLRAVLTDWDWFIAPGPERAIWAVYPPKRVVPPKTKVFINFIAERFGTPPYWEPA